MTESDVEIRSLMQHSWRWSQCRTNTAALFE